MVCWNRCARQWPAAVYPAMFVPQQASRCSHPADSLFEERQHHGVRRHRQRGGPRRVGVRGSHTFVKLLQISQCTRHTCTLIRTAAIGLSNNVISITVYGRL